MIVFFFVWFILSLMGFVKYGIGLELCFWFNIFELIFGDSGYIVFFVVGGCIEGLNISFFRFFGELGVFLVISFFLLGDGFSWLGDGISWFIIVEVGLGLLFVCIIVCFSFFIGFGLFFLVCFIKFWFFSGGRWLLFLLYLFFWLMVFICGG